MQSLPMRVAIFGATSTIAADVARCYAQRGCKLYLVGRSPDRLLNLVHELGEQAVIGHGVQDFEQTDGAERCVLQAQRALGQLDLALIAHGWLADQQQSEHSVALAERVLRVNCTSVIALLIPLANQLEAQGHGQIAVMSSVAAERGRPRNYTYAAAKAALNVYLQGLRSRLYRAQVGVCTLKLGPVDTAMTRDHTKNPLFISSPAIARQIVRALDHKKPEVFLPRRWRLIMPLVRHLPEPLFQRVGALSGR
jgi:short-subunit dehydrogenase